MEAEFSANGAVAGDSVRELLTLARQLINQRKPSQALQAVRSTKKKKFSLSNSSLVYSRSFNAFL